MSSRRGANTQHRRYLRAVRITPRPPVGQYFAGLPPNHNTTIANTAGSDQYNFATPLLKDFDGERTAPRQHNHVTTPGSELRSDLSPCDEFWLQQRANIDNVLEQAGRKPDTKMRTIQHLIDHVVYVITKLGNTFSRWYGKPAVDQVSRLQQDLEQCQHRHTGVENECVKLQQKYLASEEQRKEATTKLAKAIEERDEYRRLADSANWSGSTKVSDDTVQSMWKNLDYNILCLAKSMTKCQIVPPKATAAQERFSKITAEWLPLLMAEEYQEDMVHAYLWMIVVDQVFLGYGGIHGGVHSRNWKLLREDLFMGAHQPHNPRRQSPSIRNVARWSAQGTTLLAHFFKCDRDTLRNRTSAELDLIQSFCNIDSSKSSTNYVRELMSIIENALELDEALMSSKAMFFIERCENDPRVPLQFDEAEMSAVAFTKELSPQTIVNFYISPRLIKCGNADGYNYDSHMVLCKSLVVCM